MRLLISLQPSAKGFRRFQNWRNGSAFSAGLIHLNVRPLMLWPLWHDSDAKMWRFTLQPPFAQPLLDLLSEIRHSFEHRDIIPAFIFRMFPVGRNSPYFYSHNVALLDSERLLKQERVQILCGLVVNARGDVIHLRCDHVRRDARFDFPDLVNGFLQNDVHVPLE